MSWLLLVIAGLLEVVWAVGLAYTDGLSRLWPSVGVSLAMVVSFALLAKASQHIPAGTAYAVWVGVGVTGAFFVEGFLSGQTPSALRVLLVIMLVIATIGLSVTARHG